MSWSAIAALDRARREEGLRVARDIADDAIALIAGGAANRPETAVRLKQAGLDPAGPLVVAVAGYGGAGRDRARRARRRRGAPRPARRSECTRARRWRCCPRTTPAGEPAGAVLGRALGRLAPGLGTDRLVVGVSRPSGPDALSGALQEARHARDVAALRPGPLHVVTGAEVVSHVALLATVPDDVRRAFAARVLDPVLDYDARTGAGLRETLEAFLDCSGSWSRTAARLHLHVNTVRYRIGRVEELTGPRPRRARGPRGRVPGTTFPVNLAPIRTIVLERTREQG